MKHITNGTVPAGGDSFMYVDKDEVEEFTMQGKINTWTRPVVRRFLYYTIPTAERDQQLVQPELHKVVLELLSQALSKVGRYIESSRLVGWNFINK